MQISDEMYLILFNAITDALVQMDKGNLGSARFILKDAQLQTEEMAVTG